MNRILELREKRANLWSQTRDFLATHTKDGALSPEDAASYDKYEQEITDLTATIERMERMDTIGKALDNAVDAPIRVKPGVGGKAGRASDDYKKAFWDRMKNGRVTNALQVGTDSEGGYLVPDEFEHTLVEALNDNNVIRSLAHVITTDSGSRAIPIVTTKGTAAWTDEEAEYHESDTAYGQVSLSSHKMTRTLKISKELLNDSAFDMAAHIAAEFGRCFGVTEENAFINGDGSIKPLGLLAATGGAETGATTTAPTSITFDNVFDLYYSLRAPYRSKAVFLMNDLSVKALRKLKDQNGIYIWQPSVSLGAPDMLLGRPLYTSPFMPEIDAATKVMLFGDFSYYWIADREARSFQRLDELYATTGQVGFLADQRVDGKLILPEAMKCMVTAAASGGGTGGGTGGT